jgi:chemotaxis response regulator CheB
VYDVNAAYDAKVKEEKRKLRCLCVGRHAFLSDHFARFFAEIGVETRDATGLEQALSVSRDYYPEVVICEYELLATLSLEAWEKDELLSRMPVIAVSLTRRPQEAHLLDINGIGGFLYLPILDRDAALRLISAAAAVSRKKYISTAPSTSLMSEAEIAST